MNTPRVMEKVAEQLGTSESVEKIANRIDIRSNSDSQIISVRAEAASPEEAARLVNLTVETFQSEISALMKINNVHVLSKAKVGKDNRPVKPSLLINSLISFVLGGFLSLIIIFLKETMFARADSQAKVEKAFQLPSLGEISVIKEKPKEQDGTVSKDDRYFKLLPRLDPYSPVTEAYRSVRTNLQYMLNQEGAKTMLLTSTNPGEGKSLTAANLGICFAMDRMKTVYVDLDLRKGVGQQLFRVPIRKGISSYLEGVAELDEIISKTEISNLNYIGTGPLPITPSELISSTNMDKLIGKLRDEFDLILIDSPPLLVSDAVILANKVDGCIFVIDAKKTKINQAQQSLQQLRKVDAKVLGVILNNCKSTNQNSYYY